MPTEKVVVMNSEPMRRVSDTSWREWKDACSIGNCTRPDTISELVAFGRKRLAKALSRYDVGLAQYYCDEDPKRAWLALEEFLYAGIGKRGGRAGKSYKDALFLNAQNSSHLEALLSCQIAQELTRHLLHTEGYSFSQAESDDGEKRDSWKRDVEEFTEEYEEIYVEPVENEDSIRVAAKQQAEILWEVLQCDIERLVLACFINNKLDVDEILKSGLVCCSKSKLYNVRKKIVTAFESLEWPGCSELRQKAYMTRHTIPFVAEKIGMWLERVENLQAKRFICGKE